MSFIARRLHAWLLLLLLAAFVPGKRYDYRRQFNYTTVDRRANPATRTRRTYRQMCANMCKIRFVSVDVSESKSRRTGHRVDSVGHSGMNAVGSIENPGRNPWGPNIFFDDGPKPDPRSRKTSIRAIQLRTYVWFSTALYRWEIYLKPLLWRRTVLV